MAVEVICALIGVGGIVVGYLTKLFIDKETLAIEHRQKVIQDMRPQVHKYCEKYYLPVASMLTSLASSLKKANETSDSYDIEESFFRLAQYLRLVYNNQLEAVCILLGNRTSEYLIQYFDNLIYESFISLPERSEIIKQMDNPYELLTDFRKRLATNQSLELVFEKYKDWFDKNANKIPGIVHDICCASDLYVYEVNTVYAPWYRQGKPILSESGSTAVKLVLKTLRENGVISKEEEQKYLERIEPSNIFRRLLLTVKWNLHHLYIWLKGAKRSAEPPVA